uniref:Type I inositol 3,4-bisphosphate 4-phosphatase n=1 Tax=Phallusia mammillata TaxID=59560 RepID=A0A6F9DFU4_9ASCI|nr:type I inositol 3,4-bisphosphate 4-phosphatase [Phallusia mammillata]
MAVKVITTQPVMEISLRCSDLKKLVGTSAPCVMISVHHCEPSHGFWTPHSQTDVVHDSIEPTFLTTVCFQQSDDITLTSRLRFIVYRVKKPASNNVEELGAAFCVFKDLWERKDDLELHLLNEGSYAGRLHLSVVNRGELKHQEEKPKISKSGKIVVPVDQVLAASVKQNTECTASFDNNSLLQAMFCNPTTRTYRFPTDADQPISVQELMLETKLSFHIPIAFLKVCINEETKKVASYDSFDRLTNHWDSVRQRRVATCKKYLERYNARMKHLMLINKNPYFKKSVDKTDENLEFVATNLHLQRLRVQNNKFIRQDSSPTGSSSDSPMHQSPTSPCAEYDFVTVGAATAHAMGFKQGGLLSQLTNMDEGGKSKKSLPLHPIAHCLRKSSKRSDHLSSTIINLEKQIAYQIEKLRALVSQISEKSTVDLYSSDKVTASHESLASLSTKTCEFVTCLDCEEITESVLNLANARPVYRPLYDETEAGAKVHEQTQGASVLVNGTSKVAFNRMSVSSGKDVSPEGVWEDLKLSVKSTLADVVKSVHGIITPELEAGFLRGEVSGRSQHGSKAMEDLSSLRTYVSKSCDEATSSFAFQELSQPDISFQNELSYRRKLVFCQALSSCVCGVTAALGSSINNEIILDQYAQVGILFQVESLLSTYGNELGMLQDYSVGVMDLINVSFKCVRASQQHHLASDEAVTEENLLPLLKGSTDALTVLLPLADLMFAKLPRKLKNGSLIKVHPVIYNIGINEEQTLAEKFGNTSLQEYLNMEAVQRTLSYYDSVRDSCPNCINEQLRSAGSFLRENSQEKVAHPAVGRRKSSSPVLNEEPDSHRPIMDLMNSLSQAVHAKKNKNVEVLQLSSDVARRLNGVRVTSCKSAKDRTAMAVTLEQVRILTNEHRMARHMFNSALSCMRSEGTRRENTLKNVGARKYAFTSVQLLTFPKLYRAPEGTYGKADS